MNKTDLVKFQLGVDIPVAQPNGKLASEVGLQERLSCPLQHC